MAWLASDSAEIASDWRVESAREIAASAFMSAFIRLPEPVSSRSTIFLVKSWRVCTTDRFEPRLKDGDFRPWLLSNPMTPNII